MSKSKLPSASQKPWRPRARKAWAYSDDEPDPLRAADQSPTCNGKKGQPVRIIPEADYQRLLEMAGLGKKARAKHG